MSLPLPPRAVLGAAGTTPTSAAWPVLRAMILAVALAVLVVLEVALGTSPSQPYDLMQVVWCRYTTHLALLMVFLGWRGEARLWRIRRPFLQVGLSLLMLVMTVSFAMALVQGAQADLVWAEFWTAPVIGIHLPFAAVLSELNRVLAVGRHDLVSVALLAIMFAWIWRRAADLKVDAPITGVAGSGSSAR